MVITYCVCVVRIQVNECAFEFWRWAMSNGISNFNEHPHRHTHIFHVTWKFVYDLLSSIDNSTWCPTVRLCESLPHQNCCLAWRDAAIAVAAELLALEHVERWKRETKCSSIRLFSPFFQLKYIVRGDEYMNVTFRRRMQRRTKIASIHVSQLFATQQTKL